MSYVGIEKFKPMIISRAPLTHPPPPPKGQGGTSKTAFKDSKYMDSQCIHINKHKVLTIMKCEICGLTHYIKCFRFHDETLLLCYRCREDILSTSLSAFDRNLKQKRYTPHINHTSYIKLILSIGMSWIGLIIGVPLSIYLAYVIFCFIVMPDSYLTFPAILLIIASYIILIYFNTRFKKYEK